jgi:hypothetical protein
MAVVVAIIPGDGADDSALAHSRFKSCLLSHKLSQARIIAALCAVIKAFIHRIIHAVVQLSQFCGDFRIPFSKLSVLSSSRFRQHTLAVFMRWLCIIIPGITRCFPALGFLLLLAGLTARAGMTSTNLGHPRLYCTTAEVARLREAHDDLHARIWSNLVQSADWCLTKTPRTN